MSSSPPLSVAIPSRDGYDDLAPVLAALRPAIAAHGIEIVLSGPFADVASLTSDLAVIDLPSSDMLLLRREAAAVVSGEVVAIGEDHAVPRPDWCEAVLRAHAEQPEVDAIAGCLVNATADTRSGRANFLAFGGAWQPPLKALPAHRPPPASAITFKRRALAGVGSKPPGWIEAELIPDLFAAGEIGFDERIVVDHFQDHGSWWAIRNAYDSARSSYGSARLRLDAGGRRRTARWALRNIPAQLRAEAGSGAAPIGGGDRALVTAIATAAGIGATFGTLRGPGCSADRVA